MGVKLRELRPSDLADARRMLREACPFDRAADVAEEKLFGPAPSGTTRAWAASDGGALCGVAAASGRWVRLVAVAPPQRGRGVGTGLLSEAEAWIAGAGHDTASALDQPGNYLAPGIDERNEPTIAWLERRGWQRGKPNVNLLIDVATNPRVSPERLDRAEANVRAAGYDIREATPHDIASYRGCIAQEFSLGWAFELERADVHIACRGSELAAFAAHDGNNRGLGWFGPAGTRAQHRKRGLGEVLLLRCLLDVAAAGHDVCAIAWIGPREFYERAVGAAPERRYISMTKPL